MMEAYWRSAVPPDRLEGIGAFNDGREPTFQDSDYWCAQTARHAFSPTRRLNVGVADDFDRERSGLQVIKPAPYNAEAPPDALTGDITPTAMHYVRSNFAVPEHDGTLTVDGAVENPMNLTLDGLRALTAHERVVTLECAGNRASRDASATDRRTMGRLCRLDGTVDRRPPS